MTTSTKINKKNQVHTFSFYREQDGNWYVDFPEFIEQGHGTKANLQMVAGADTMLEHVAPEGHVTATFSNAPLSNHHIHIRKLIADPWGATYWMSKFPFKKMWLCNVSKFIFGGHHPSNIFIQFHNL